VSRSTRPTRPARLALALACLAVLAAGPAAPRALAATAPARVQGRFTMRTVITTAVGVRGEHRGERLTRSWWIRPGRCRRDVCGVLHLRRTRGHGRTLRLTLRRAPGGGYAGRGAFFVALSCRGRTHPHGARAPYTIRLRVTATRTVGGVRFAQRLAATYVNRTRIDRTGCSLGPSYDAARYSGRLVAGLPSPPRPAFTATVGAGGLVSFADASGPGSGPGRRVVAWRWSFGDPASGAADGSSVSAPTHQYTAPGSYAVTLTAIDHAGLAASAQQTVTVPPPPPAGALGARPGAPWPAPG
jgi:hypothetical protein